MGALHFLDLVIGMVFIYFLMSLVCVSFQELLANWRNERSKNLKKWILDTFNIKGEKGDLGEKLWNNIMVDGMTQEGASASYIPKEVFVSALLDEIYYNSYDVKNRECANDATKLKGYQLKTPYDFNSLLTAINDPSVCLPQPFQRVLRQIHAESHENLETFRMRLERWFEMAMDRNAGTYKKKVQNFTFWFAVFLTVFLNVDSIKLADYLSNNHEVATQIANTVELSLEGYKSQLDTTNGRSQENNLEEINTNIEKLYKLNLPIGWSNADLNGFVKFITALAGWTITAFAVSLGAPFWFDMLNKLVNIRAAGKMPNGGTNSPSTTSPKDNKPAVG